MVESLKSIGLGTEALKHVKELPHCRSDHSCRCCEVYVVHDVVVATASMSLAFTVVENGGVGLPHH